MGATEASQDRLEGEFTLDDAVLAQRRAERARRVHTVQIPVIRAVGFAILSLIVVVHDVHLGVPFPNPPLARLLVLNLGFALLSWLVLRFGWRTAARVDLSLVF